MTCPLLLVVWAVSGVVSFCVSTICRLPEKMLLTNARFLAPLVGVVGDATASRPYEKCQEGRKKLGNPLHRVAG